MPDGVSTQRYAQHHMLHHRSIMRRKDVGADVVDQQRGVDGSAVVDAEHIHGVALVTLAPGFVGEFVDAAAAVVALIEGYGYEAFSRTGRVG